MRRNASKQERITDTRLTKPLARWADLVVEELGDELLVYDTKVDRAHSLGAPAARVWTHCDGKTTIDALSARAAVDLETVTRALGELEACDLLDAAPQLAGGSTRREATVKVAKFSGAAVAAPLIASLAVPAAAAAATARCGGTCTGNGQCNVPGLNCCCCKQVGSNSGTCVARGPNACPGNPTGECNSAAA